MDEKKGERKNIPIRYKKNTSYETFFADGAMGGWTPRKNLSLDFYVEKAATPDIVVHELTEEGHLGELIERKGDVGFVREKQLGIVMNVQTVVELRDWLTAKIEEGQEKGIFEIQKLENKDTAK
ncbi:hypothetical protein [Rhodohalobacter sulfatireducens]|uniref:PilZ domain-containing protein n=1 Tax=Rhodohalobacter sulfatireducens TaxID=2911366 RepID=A0ABS9KE40_9BACT|nr:hypothetical protein [Rhodohalobacter sulfatireducens]MCG2589122.1 hypothetical protein [Rhodohalobacter sulfatireducens]